MKSALTAFEAEDFATAERVADTIMTRDGGNDAARQLRDRARASAAAVSDGLAKARTLAAADRFEEASRAAGAVLAVAPGNSEARQIMADGAARSRGHGADEARTQVASARSAARAAGAQRLAASSYAAAVDAEREAQRLYGAGRAGDATIKFYEASGLFRSAEVAAQNETMRRQSAARAERAPATEVARTSPLPSKPGETPTVETRDPAREAGSQPAADSTPAQVPAPPPAPAPAPPQAPVSTTTAPPTTTIPPAPVAPAAPSPEALAAARQAAIDDVLSRYKAAVEGRNLEALKRIWPGLPEEALRTEFRRDTKISVGIVDPRISAATNDTATVNFVRHYDVVIDGDTHRSQSNATMELRRSGNSWIIERIRFDTRR
jgi:hypothetical protein